MVKHILKIISHTLTFPQFIIFLWGSYHFRSSCPEVFYWKGVLTKFANSTWKHLCQSLFFNKVAALRPATLLKDRFSHRCFPVDFSKYLTLVQDKRLFFFQILSVNLSVSAFRSIPSLRVKQVCKIFFYYEPFSKVLQW